MRIGIVLAAVPGYSETFFRSKIRFLNETKGIEVVLFADRKMPNVSWAECTVVYGSIIQGKGFLGSVKLMRLLFHMCLWCPIKSWRLFTLNKQSGFGFYQNIKSLAQSAHLLNHKLDWLHFGFGTMALGRENVARVIKAKMAVSFRGFDIAIYPLKHPHCYDLVWKNVDKVHVISDDLGALVNKNGYPQYRPMQKVTPAIDTTKFIQPNQYKSLNTPLKIITVARLHWKKGLEHTLDSLRLLKQKDIDFHYTIVGEGEEYERLVFAVHQLELRQQVTFSGKLSPEEVIEKLKEADLYIQFSIQEGFCNAVLEAQAMELLCIVSDAEGLSENVLHNVTGWVVPRRNPLALAKQVEEVMAMDSQSLNEFRRQAKERIEQQFNLERQKKLFLEFYEFNNSLCAN